MSPAGDPAPDGAATVPAPAPTRLVRAAADIRAGARAWRLWATLAWNDIRLRYRRSIIGPFWLTISMGAMVGALGVVYASLFKQSIDGYLAYLALGLIVWALISNAVVDGCWVFVGAEGVIKQIALPISLHVYRLLWRSLIVFAHNFCIYIIVAVAFALWPGGGGLLALAGLALLVANLGWLVLALGLVSTRFRDVPQMVASLMQLIFFLTPILWRPEQIGDRAWIAAFNPLHHWVEVVRAPLLGQAASGVSWLVAAGSLLLGWAFAFALFARFRARIAYWL